jgi:hypothetical protein
MLLDRYLFQGADSGCNTFSVDYGVRACVAHACGILVVPCVGFCGALLGLASLCFLQAAG